MGIKNITDLLPKGDFIEKFKEWEATKPYFFVSSVDGLTQCRNDLVCGIWKFKAWKGQIM
jgi:hypothetical protein